MPTPKNVASLPVNDALFNAGVAHAVTLQHYGNDVVASSLSHINNKMVPDLERVLTARLKKGKTRGPGAWTTRWYKDMIDAADGVVASGVNGLKKGVTAEMKKLAVSEGEIAAAQMAQATPINVNFRVPNTGMLTAIATSTPFQGKLLKQWFNGISRKSQKAVTAEIAAGVAAGLTNRDIVRNVISAGGPLKLTKHQVESTVRTAIAHTSNGARNATYQRNGDIVKGVRFVATLDMRTTDICMGLDGKVYEPTQGPRPPMHHQCRSTTVPVLKSWKELGIDLKEAPAGTRASMNGQVPAKTTYGQWLKKQPKWVQDRALGPARARLFRQGKVKIDRFVNKRGRRLTLKEIRKREGLGKTPVKQFSAPMPDRAYAGNRMFASDVAGVSLTTQQIQQIHTLWNELKIATANSDKALAKKLRGRLRKLGHKGGLKKSPPPLGGATVPAPTKVTPDPTIKKPIVKTPKPKPVKKGWEKIGGQQGSNPGGTYRDPDGVDWYLKKISSEDNATNELLANALYRRAGVRVPEMKRVHIDGENYLASKIVPNLKSNKPVVTKKVTLPNGSVGVADDIADGFAMDAWLANWDVVGLSHDNLLIDDLGRAWRIDQGGSMMFRAQGGSKSHLFKAEVGELDTLRGIGVNNPAAKSVFGHMTDAQIASSIDRVAIMSDDVIRAVVNEVVGGKDVVLADRYINVLIQRRDNLMGKRAKFVKPKAAPKLPTKPQPVIHETKPTTPKPVSGAQAEITSLLDQLKHSTDKREKQRIRRRLRKLGHKGGLKSEFHAHKPTVNKFVDPDPKPKLADPEAAYAKTGQMRGTELRADILDKLAAFDATATVPTFEGMTLDVVQGALAKFENAPVDFADINRLRRAEQVLLAETAKHARKRNAVIHEALFVPQERRANIVRTLHKTGAPVKGEAAKRIDDGFDFIEKLLDKRVVGDDALPVYFKQTTDNRSYHINGGIRMAKDAPTSVVVHELGHVVEYLSKQRFASNPEQSALAKARAFLKKRAGTSSKTPIYAGTKEMGWKDDFIHHYMGKDYGDDATELISMGVEMLHKNPMKLLADDPEMFDFVIDVLRGYDPTKKWTIAKAAKKPLAVRPPSVAWNKVPSNNSFSRSNLNSSYNQGGKPKRAGWTLDTPGTSRFDPKASLTDQLNQWGSSLTTEEYGALRAFTGSAYQTLRRWAVDKAGTNLDDVMRLMDYALATSPAKKKKFYRGIRLSKDAIDKNWVVGNEVDFKTVTSLSTSESIAKSFSGGSLVMEFEDTAATSVRFLSLHKSENEWVVRPNSKYIITGKRKEGKYTYVTMKQVDVGGVT